MFLSSLMPLQTVMVVSVSGGVMVVQVMMLMVLQVCVNCYNGAGVSGSGGGDVDGVFVVVYDSLYIFRGDDSTLVLFFISFRNQ